MAILGEALWRQLARLPLMVWVGLACVAYVGLYLAVRSASMNGIPPEALKLSPRRWTEEQLQDAYEKAKKNPADVRKFLPPRTGRRYVVVGGSGLVGGWMVQHLLMRGEDPTAIRVVDITPLRPDARDTNVAFVKTDIRDPKSVKNAFDLKWPASVAELPLTVFHTAAILDEKHRAKDMIEPFLQVNTVGTQNIVNASKTAGATVLVATSSSSIAVKPVNFFPAIWRRYPTDWIQVSDNAEPPKTASEMKHEDYFGNYAKTKHLAETIVREADSKKDGFRTGCIRPGHAIYGYGVDNRASFVYTNLSLGGFPSWLHDIVQHYVNAQNVSIAHLLYEQKLIDPTALKTKDLGGGAYSVTDPNEPRTFGDVYAALELLADSPIQFPRVSAQMMALMSYFVEAYITFQRRYASFLPPVTGSPLSLQPAMLRVSTVHFVIDTSRAKQDLGYQGPISTLDGMAMDILDWNKKWALRSPEEKLRFGPPGGGA